MTDKMLAILGLILLGLAGLASVVTLAVTQNLGGDVESLLSTVISGALVGVAALTHPGTTVAVAPPVVIENPNVPEEKKEVDPNG